MSNKLNSTLHNWATYKIYIITNFLSANKFETMKTREARVHLEHNLGHF